MRTLSIWSKPALATCLISLFGGGLFSLIVPTLSVFLAEHLNVSPFLVGSFFVAMALTSIVFTQSLGHLSDTLGDRRHMLLLGLVSGGIACSVFAFSRSYLVILLAGLSFLSFSIAALAQMLAYTREFADEFLPKEKCALFNATVRACVAIAWVGGPPLGFYLFNTLGITLHYLLVGCFYIAIGISAVVILTPVKRVQSASSDPIKLHDPLVITALVAFVLLYSCNQAYIICLPLFLPEVLSTPSSEAGWIYGTAAGLEVPIMILSGWLATRIPLIWMIRVGAVAAAILYTGFYFAQEMWHLFALQFFNAVFIGTTAGLGMTWFQNLMPGKAGTASALFMNTISAGNVVGSGVVALVAHWYSYHSVYGVAIFIALTSSLLLLFVSTSAGENKKDGPDITTVEQPKTS